jgi:NADH dehydrogenase/NADH:ubiquinone oxidoreductase subunit G
MNYRWMSRGDRIEAPLVKHDGAYRAVDWDEALDHARTALRGAQGKAVALVSPAASSEALFLVRQLLEGLDFTGAFQLVMGEAAPLAGVPNLALRPERAPNGTGAELLGYGKDFAAALAAAASAAVVLVLDDPQAAVETAGTLIYLGTVPPEHESARTPDIVLPITNVAEEEGTFVNRDGRVQRYLQAKPAPGMARPAWWVLAELMGNGERGTGKGIQTAADAFAVLAESVDGFAGLSYTELGLGGKTIAAGTLAGVPA